MNKENVLAVLRDLNLVSGFRVSLHAADFSEIAAYPEQKLPFCAFLHEHSAEEYALDPKLHRVDIVYKADPLLHMEEYHIKNI